MMSAVAAIFLNVPDRIIVPTANRLLQAALEPKLDCTHLAARAAFR